MSGLRDLQLRDGRVVPVTLLAVQFARASGPGGQNVNKVATKVDLRVDLDAARPLLSDAEIAQIRARLRTRLDGSGRLHVRVSLHREQARNLEVAHERLETLISEALTRRKVRHKTKPTRSSQKRRVDTKRHRGRLKQTRTGHGSDGE